ncbi:unnamed protein product [Macrosiphum euphorbiae]|uniref:Uncharacterized protein n=1 Tax=Macrosiphum euphorbiae TaxID=13131 RepID=A0AAV0WEW2_9HEMI|nr:unnamed protein product [Macrosiphum euphorbiae]
MVEVDFQWSSAGSGRPRGAGPRVLAISGVRKCCLMAGLSNSIWPRITAGPRQAVALHVVGDGGLDCWCLNCRSSWSVANGNAAVTVGLGNSIRKRITAGSRLAARRRLVEGFVGWSALRFFKVLWLLDRRLNDD